MKKVFLLAASVGLFLVSSCDKKEKAVEIQEETTDTSGIVEETITEEQANNSAGSTQLEEVKAKLEKAEKDLEEAIAKGDKKAQEAAHKAINESKLAWENLVKGTKDVSADVKTEADKAGDKIEKTVSDATKDMKKGAEDVKKDIEKMK